MYIYRLWHNTQRTDRGVGAADGGAGGGRSNKNFVLDKSTLEQEKLREVEAEDYRIDNILNAKKLAQQNAWYHFYFIL